MRTQQRNASIGEEERKYIQSIFLELGFKRVSQSTIIRPSALVSTSAGSEKSYANILKILDVASREYHHIINLLRHSKHCATF
jgi:hypothetical protein